MEEVRVESLCFIGIEFVELVNFGCDLLVVEFFLCYYEFVKLGMVVVVKICMVNI